MLARSCFSYWQGDFVPIWSAFCPRGLCSAEDFVQGDFVRFPLGYRLDRLVVHALKSWPTSIQQSVPVRCTSYMNWHCVSVVADK